MKLSVIIVNWNVRDLLRDCLASLYASLALPPEDFEVFVVDNASQDGSVAMVAREFPQVLLVANADNRGFGSANNQVLERCQGDYVLLLNPDTVVPEGAIDRLLAHADARPETAVLGCRLLNLDGSLQRWTGGAFPTLLNVACHYLWVDRLLPRSWRCPSLYLQEDHAEDVEVDWVSGAVMLLRRECLGERIFDERFFMYGEDMECCHRLKGQGWRILYTPVCSVVHIQGASMKQQEGEILLSSLKGLRYFYLLTRGPRWLWLLDYLTLAGFSLRWCAYSLMKQLRGKGLYADKAASSRRYIAISRRIMQTRTRA